MARLVVEGARAAGGEAELFAAEAFVAGQVKEYDALAFGCPSMGVEELEESVFAPLFEDCKPVLAGKKIGLFGSYGWGDGEWMRNWEEDCRSDGISLVGGGVICQDAPAGEAEEECKALGRALV